ncbi:uncharacterized protein LOC119643060, partial [Glossina fuscipes]|uniref:Uncharacterized protein LOC119643060 n=1 Tax=Glossina fuscipes TaxID=7396 RepID=A0A9C6E2R3_9MUSC
MYDDILRLPLPEGASIVGFADDIAITIVAKTLEGITATANKTTDMIKRWLRSVDLELAEEKTEAVLISSRKKIEKVTIQVGDTRIQSQEPIKYLGVMIDCRHSFQRYLQYTAEKAAKVAKSLTCLLLNLRGPRQARRKLIADVVTATIMYGSSVWNNAFVIPSYTRDIQAAYRLCALRVCAGYRTVSEDAALVIAGMMPIDLRGKEGLYRAEFRRLPAEAAKQRVKQRLLYEWQERWSRA